MRRVPPGTARRLPAAPTGYSLVPNSVPARRSDGNDPAFSRRRLCAVLRRRRWSRSNERGGIILDRTVFYATGGGQPGDSGTLLAAADGADVPVATAVYGAGQDHYRPRAGRRAPHLPVGRATRVTAADRLGRPPRAHAHPHRAAPPHAVLPYPVTGGAIGDGEGRLDFDIPDAGLDKDAIPTSSPS